MNEQPQNNQPLEDQPYGTAPPARKFKLTWKFAIGFLGWYLVFGLIYSLTTLLYIDWNTRLGNIAGTILAILTSVPVQIITLLILLSVMSVRDVGWGMLSAIAVNLLISTMLSLTFNAICFIPFFIPVGSL